MLSKLFQPDKNWYDEKTRRMYGALHDIVDAQARVAGGRWFLNKIKERASQSKYQMNTLMGDIPFQK